MNRIQNTFLISFFLFLAFAFPCVGRAQTNSEIQTKIEETRKQRDLLLEQEKKIQAELDSLGKESKTLQTNVKTLDATRTKLGNDLKLTQNNISGANLTISKLENDIGQNENEIEIHKNALKESIQKVAFYDKNSFIVDILTYRSLEEVWSDTVDLWSLQNKIGERVDTLEITQTKLLENKTAKENQKKKLVSLSSQLQGQKKVADETRSAQALLLATTKNKETEYQKLLRENKLRQEEFERLIFQFESQLTASDISQRPVAGRGSVSWPLDSVFITQQFGKTSSSGRLYTSGTHNGIDFRATVGTPIKAVRAGFVSGTGNTDDERGCYSYGRWILIRHSNGLSSLYSHLSGSIVSANQEVSEGQVIGYSGGQPGQNGSGFSTGPHLHFALFATAGVQVLPYSTSKNCKNSSIPLANPNDYLDPMAYLPLA